MSQPISFPMKTLEELESKSYFDSFHYPFNKASVPLPSSSSPLADRRRLLVCHDMAGGYNDDKWVQGGTNPEAFDLTHWSLMDIFVYFSHDLVTLPPPSWTNTAHLHGVKVLGTFICEWEEGQKIANRLLSTKVVARMYAERLTELAVALGFDGWLLNMEVSLAPSIIPNLIEFVNHLTKTMHSKIPGSLVIWYDSITIDGQLSWQDRLNEKNKPFFDVCDGIFVNYTWRANFPELSVAMAGDRKFDVYMGIDVFGRNTFGGGQWNTNVALDLLKEVDVSAAVFAPGWVYETKQPPDHQTAKNHWWGLVEKSWGVAQDCLKALPFYSSFDIGHGYHFSVEGKPVSDTPWNNISCQGFQPIIKFMPENSFQVFIDYKEKAYSGGSSLTFKGNLNSHEYVMYKLFTGDILIGEDSPIFFTYSVKLEEDSQLDIYAVFTDPEDKKITVFFSSDGPDRLPSEYGRSVKAQQIGSQPAPLGWVLQEYEISEMIGNRLTEIGAGLHHQVSTSHRSKSYHAALGHVSVDSSPGDFIFPPRSSWAVRSELVQWSESENSVAVSAKISWELEGAEGREVSWFPSYYVYGRVEGHTERVFIGVARVKSFYIERFAVPAPVDFLVSRVDFFVQPCAANGRVQKLDRSPFIRLVEPPRERN